MRLITGITEGFVSCTAISYECSNFHNSYFLQRRSARRRGSEGFDSVPVPIQKRHATVGARLLNSSVHCFGECPKHWGGVRIVTLTIPAPLSGCTGATCA